MLCLHVKLLQKMLFIIDAFLPKQFSSIDSFQLLLHSKSYQGSKYFLQ